MIIQIKPDLFTQISKYEYIKSITGFKIKTVTTLSSQPGLKKASRNLGPFTNCANENEGAVIVIVIVIALCLQYELKGYPRKFLELLTCTPPHLTFNQVSYHSAESIEEIA